jgi:DNA-binding NarL/FixJ family response regulator
VVTDTRFCSTHHPLRVLVVDDDSTFTELLDVLLSDDGRLSVVGRAGDGVGGVELALALQPDVVVMDIEMPVLDGIAAAGRIRRQLPETRVVFLTGTADLELLAHARTSGAEAFLHKGCDFAELLDAVRGRPAAPVGSRSDAVLPAA